MDIKAQTYKLIDDLKAVCHNYGMGNDGNEYKVITQIFLYKFLNDKFGYEIKKKDSRIASTEKWETAYSELPEDDRLDLLDSLSPDIPRLYPEHLISTLWNQQAKGDFDLIFDSTMVDIADKNIDIFSTQTTKNTKIPLFEKLTNFVTDDAQRAPFARALVDKLVNFSFEDAFAESYDFFAGVFEYVIKDYNTNGGGVYAEYYTPHAIAVIMARLLVGDRQDLHNIECYDPAAGTGTLLMALAHQIGEDRCTIFAQDRSQKSNKMLKLNLILNGLVSSLDHAIQGDTLTDPFHMSDDGKSLRQFDYEVCNPPFNLDFSETRETLAAMPARFWAGIPNVPKKKKESMSIYTCFLQHVCDIIDGPHATPTKTESGPVYLGIDAITEDGRLNEADFAHLSVEDYKKWTRRVTPTEGDIVFSYEATLGRYAVIPKGFYGCLGRRLAVIRNRSEAINTKWLYYYFRSPEWDAFIRRNTIKGSTVNRISVEDFPNYTIPAVKREQQDRIAGILGAIDKKISTNNAINDNLAA